MSTIRAIVADDHPVVRAGLKALLGTEADIEVVGEAATPEEAVARAQELRPDIVLLDLRFGTDTTGVDATAAIRALEQPPAVLILTNYDTDADILGAIEAGANGYLLKDAPPAQLIGAIRAAARGESALAPAVAGRMMERLRSPQLALTAREIAVLEAIARGESNARAAADLHVTEATVKSHLAHIYGKLGVRSRSGAVAVARDQGIIG